MVLNNKFTIIYSFIIIESKEDVFINTWTELTKLIYEYEGSYGSRLHKINSTLFIGYAQWSDEDAWKQSGGKLPEEASKLRKQMRESCSEIKTEYEMIVVQDLLHDKRYNEIENNNNR